MPNPSSKKIHWRNALWLGLSALAIVLDQWTKWLAETYLTFHEPVPVMPLLNWTLAYNTGAAFSFLSTAGGWQQYFFVALASGMSLIFIFWLLRLSPKLVILPMALALILGGAVGNLIDRVTLGHVVDFIHVYWGDSHFPIFNIADCAITLGAILLLIDSLFLESKRNKADKK
ncbi:MAG: signal peptidase II [Acinetobacter sp.]|nr:signal peptidase II [Acinetobacter sp.]